MKNQHIKYSSIGQFRNVVKNVREQTKWNAEETGGSPINPVIKFTGTVKAHGTNASVVIKGSGEQYAQSRTNVIGLENDNAGFAAFAAGREDTFAGMRRVIDLNNPTAGLDIVIYGEWCGKGIQKGVGVSQVDKFFMPFGVKVVIDAETRYWLKDYKVPLLTSKTRQIFDVREFGTYSINIDFEKPQDSQNKLVDFTNEVEKQCPIAKYFGIEGIGEGIVWQDSSQELKFKVKGEKHSSSKVKKLAEVDTEKLKSIQDFISYAVTDNRLEQMFLEVCNNEADRALLGKFIKAVSVDVVKEESDTLVASDLCMRDVGSTLSKKARTWFFNKEKI